jgi:hypothetical protein
MSIYAMTFFGLMPIGSLLVGWLATKTTEPAAIILNASVTLIYAGLVFSLMPRLRRLP